MINPLDLTGTTILVSGASSGIGRGERVRTKAIGEGAYVKKILEYLYKLAGSLILGIGYALKGAQAKSRPVVQFRIDALKGLLGK